MGTNRIVIIEPFNRFKTIRYFLENYRFILDLFFEILDRFLVFFFLDKSTYSKILQKKKNIRLFVQTIEYIDNIINSEVSHHTYIRYTGIVYTIGATWS